MASKQYIVFVLLAVAAMVAYGGLFVVNQTEQAVVLSFGKPVTVHKEPGLKFKLPLIQNVVFFDKRVLDFNAEPKEVIAADKKTLFVDAFVRYRIVDPLKFYQSVNDERFMNSRLNSILESSLREAIAGEPLTALLTPKRAQVMQVIRQKINDKLIEDSVKVPAVEAPAEGEAAPVVKSTASKNVGFGIEIVDVRIMRTELPQANSDSIYSKMRKEREREAKQNRARGEEEALRIRSRADRDRTVLLAEAQKKSETIRGEGDAEATRILGTAYNQDREFFEFYRSMQAYERVLDKNDTTLILSPDHQFLKQMGKE